MFLNPVLDGMISYADLKNGTLNLYDLFILNELLVFKNNQAVKEIKEQKRKKALKQ